MIAQKRPNPLRNFDKQKTLALLKKHQNKLIAGTVLTIAVGTGAYLWLTREPDPEVVYTDRLNQADQSLIVLDNNDTLFDNTGGIEKQISASDYNTYLAIENDQNAGEIQDEYGAATQAGFDLSQLVAKHDQETALLDGVTSVYDLIKYDTLPVRNPEQRAIILKNFGLTESEYQEIVKEYEQTHGTTIKRSSAPTAPVQDEHDHDHAGHDHDHDHSHDHQH